MGKSSFLAKLHANSAVTFDTGAELIIDDDLTVNTNTLHVDASTGRVGIGTTTPDTFFHVDDQDGTGPTAIFEGGGTNINTPSDNEQTVFVKTGSGTGDLTSGIGFWSTFESTPADTNHRRAVDIRAGFDGGAWGNEFVSFHVGKGTGSTSNDTAAMTDERLRITKTTVTASVPIEDDIGNVRRAGTIDISSTPYDLTSTTTGQILRVTAGGANIDIDTTDVVDGDVFGVYNENAANCYLNFGSGFTYVRIQGGNTSYTSNTLVIGEFGMASLTILDSDRVIVSGNISEV